ncbi:MAG: TIM barrel protein [Cloacibacillus sp.]
MTRKYSVAHLTWLQWTPPEMIYNAHAIGFDRVSLRTISQGLAGEISHDLSKNNQLFKLTKQALSDTGIKINDIELAKIDPGTTDIKKYEPHLEAAAELGVTDVITNIWSPDPCFYEEKFGQLCDLAAKYGMDVNLEFVTWAEVKDLKAALDLVRTSNKQNARILLDTLHFYRSHVSLDELKAAPKYLFKTVHVCDAGKKIPTDKESLVHTGRAERLYIGEGAIDIASIVRLLNDDVVLCPEMPHLERVSQIGAFEHVRRTLATAKDYFKQHGIN